jgi:cysteine desulfurase/selenocysteine lyase
MTINNEKEPALINNERKAAERWETVINNWSLQHPYSSRGIAGKEGGTRYEGNGAGNTCEIRNAVGSHIAAAGAFPVEKLRRDFPILSETVNGNPLIWLDNAATTQKPACVIDRLEQFYRHENSNIHRGVHTLAERATDAFEGARESVGRFLHAKSPKEIVFVRGATEAINLVARTYGKQNIGKGDEILITHLEHHANIVPWQLLCEETGAVLRVIPVDDTGQVELPEYAKLLNEKTKLVSVTHVSNALGTVVPVREMAGMAHAAGAKVFIDGAQAVSHMPVDVTELGCDFYAFSGHKVCGPTGIGALYAKWEILEDLPPYQGGGNMISNVSFEKTEYRDPPDRFEAGTANIAGAAGLGAALDYVSGIGMERISAYEHELTEYAMNALRTVPGLTLIGTAERKASILSFILKGYPDAEVGKALDREGIAVRAGHHCAQPILRRFSLESTVRPSIAFYNTRDEIDKMVQILRRLSKKG